MVSVTGVAGVRSVPGVIGDFAVTRVVPVPGMAGVIGDFAVTRVVPVPGMAGALRLAGGHASSPTVGALGHRSLLVYTPLGY